MGLSSEPSVHTSDYLTKNGFFTCDGLNLLDTDGRYSAML